MGERDEGAADWGPLTDPGGLGMTIKDRAEAVKDLVDGLQKLWLVRIAPFSFVVKKLCRLMAGGKLNVASCVPTAESDPSATAHH